MSKELNIMKYPISENLSVTPISKIMRRQVYHVVKGSTVRMAMKTMLVQKVSGLPVLDSNGKCVGVYSELDAMLQGASQDLDRPIKFTAPALFVSVDDIFKEVLVLLVKKRIKRVPVLDAQQRLVGVVSRRDMLEALFKDLEEQSSHG